MGKSFYVFAVVKKDGTQMNANNTKVANKPGAKCNFAPEHPLTA
jgi:hypothetical protein